MSWICRYCTSVDDLCSSTYTWHRPFRYMHLAVQTELYRGWWGGFFKWVIPHIRPACFYALYSVLPLYDRTISSVWQVRNVLCLSNWGGDIQVRAVVPVRRNQLSQVTLCHTVFDGYGHTWTYSLLLCLQLGMSLKCFMSSVQIPVFPVSSHYINTKCGRLMTEDVY